MPPHNHATLTEITTQTAAWEDAIAVVKQKAGEIQSVKPAGYDRVITAGCGSTYYLSLTAAHMIQSAAGVCARALPSSELLLFPETYYGKGKTLLIAFSRSGSTSETYHVVKEFKKFGRGDVILFTNYPETPLAAESDIVLTIHAGQEVSVAQTRSFSSMLVAANAAASLFRPGAAAFDFGKGLADAGNRLIVDYESIARELGNSREIRQFFFLGSGPRYGLACEASLKLKEMSQTVCEPFHFMEFRHGPISMVDSQTLVVGLVSEQAENYELSVLEDVRKFGSRVFTIGEKNTDVQFRSGLREIDRSALYLPILQLLAYHRAVSLGKNPDVPRNITAVVNLDIN